MAIESTELKFQWTKKGDLKVTYKETKRMDTGDKHVYTSPETHKLQEAEEERKEMLFNSLSKALDTFLKGGTLSYFNNDDDED